MAKYTKWNHPDFPSAIIEEVGYSTREEVMELFADNEDADINLLTEETIELTEDEYNNLPEFEG